MSVEAVIDIAVHLGSFKTYDMLAQGTYRLKVTGSLVENTGQKIPAVPYLILDNRFSKNKLRQHLFEAEIDSKENAVFSNSFFVRYCDQETLLDHVSLFRISYTGISVQNYEVLFELQLLTLDIDGEKPPKGKQPVQDKDGFVLLTTTTLRLNRVAQGIHEYLPVIFGDYMFSFADCHFHSTMMGTSSSRSHQVRPAHPPVHQRRPAAHCSLSPRISPQVDFAAASRDPGVDLRSQRRHARGGRDLRVLPRVPARTPDRPHPLHRLSREALRKLDSHDLQTHRRVHPHQGRLRSPRNSCSPHPQSFRSGCRRCSSAKKCSSAKTSTPPTSCERDSPAAAACLRVSSPDSAVGQR